MGMKYKNLEKSIIYKFVRRVMDERGNYWWCANTCGKSKLSLTEREAAKNVDLIRMAKGKEPINIFVKKIV